MYITLLKANKALNILAHCFYLNVQGLTDSKQSCLSRPFHPYLYLQRGRYRIVRFRYCFCKQMACKLPNVLHWSHACWMYAFLLDLREAATAANPHHITESYQQQPYLCLWTFPWGHCNNTSINQTSKPLRWHCLSVLFNLKHGWEEGCHCKKKKKWNCWGELFLKLMVVTSLLSQKDYMCKVTLFQCVCFFTVGCGLRTISCALSSG